MTAFNLSNKNILTFKRLPSADVSGYKVNVKETLQDGVISNYLLTTIPNPSQPSPINHIQEMQYIKKLTYTLPNDIYYSYDCPVIVLINHVQLNVLQYTYDEQLNLLTINLTNIKETDLIEVGYYKDEIQYSHSTINKCEYYIEPVIYYAHNMGDHNILL